MTTKLVKQKERDLQKRRDKEDVVQKRDRTRDQFSVFLQGIAAAKGPKKKTEEDVAYLVSINFCKNCEIGVFNAAVKKSVLHGIQPSWANQSFAILYETVAKELEFTLAHTDAMQLILQKKCLPHHLTMCPSYDVLQSRWGFYKLERRKREETMFEVDMNHVTDQFFCKQCKERKCVYQEKQTRSADEPMTIFIHCINCGNRWRQ